MGLAQRIVWGQVPSGTLGVTGAAPQTVSDPVAGHYVNMLNVESGSLSATVALQATTSSLALTCQWQIADPANALVWVNCEPQPNSPANVTIVTGTGSAVASTVVVPAPAAVYGARYARLVVLSSGATGGGTAGGDQCSISYRYRLPSPFIS